MNEGAGTSPKRRALSSAALRVATLLLVTGLAGCSNEEPWAGTIEVIDGVTHVRNPAGPLWTDEDGPRLSFELEQVFGADADPIDAILGQPYGLYPGVDADGRVYVLDGQANNLVAFEPDGNVRWRVGRKGQGPGELDDPAGLAVSAGGDIVVFNHSRTRIDRWSAEGGYISGFLLSEAPLSLPAREFLLFGGLSGQGELVMFGGIWGGVGSRVAVLDIETPAVRSRFEWNQLPDLKMPRNVSSEAPVRGDDGSVTMGSGAGYQFRVYNADGSLLRQVTRAVDYPPRSGFVATDDMQGIMSFGQVLAPMFLDPDYWLVGVTWTPDVADPDAITAARFEALRGGERLPPLPRMSSYDLYDREGRFLYSLREDREEGEESGQWPGTGRPILIGPDNRLYTIAEDPFPQIRRYRVVVR